MSVPASELNHLPAELQNGSKYSNDDRARAVYTYIATGTIKRTALATNIPSNTLYEWYKTSWWADIDKRVREEKRDEYNAGFSRIIEKSMQVIEKQLDSGEVKARDAATIMGISFDKRQILNLQPTSITAKTTDINGLQAQFEDYLKAKTIDVDVVSTNKTD